VFPYDLRSQVLGHVGDRGVGVIRLLRADHYWGAAIFVLDPYAAPASVRPVAPVMMDVIMSLLHG
jgi:hypothetical protein